LLVIPCGLSIYGTYFRTPILIHREFNRHSANNDEVLKCITGFCETDSKRSDDFVENEGALHQLNHGVTKNSQEQIAMSLTTSADGPAISANLEKSRFNVLIYSPGSL
jgi:hypothetical protein